jgi:hypothetical protein
MHKSSHNKRVLPKCKRQIENENKYKPEFYGHGYWAQVNQGIPPPIPVKDNTTCPCNKEDQTVDHLIYRCTLLHTNREPLRVNVQQSGNWPASKQELITKHLKPFLPFTKSINFDEL